MFIIPDSGDLVMQPSIDNQVKKHPDIYRQANRFTKSDQRHRDHAIPVSASAQNSMNVSR